MVLIHSSSSSISYQFRRTVAGTYMQAIVNGNIISREIKKQYLPITRNYRNHLNQITDLIENWIIIHMRTDFILNTIRYTYNHSPIIIIIIVITCHENVIGAQHMCSNLLNNTYGTKFYVMCIICAYYTRVLIVYTFPLFKIVIIYETILHLCIIK